NFRMLKQFETNNLLIPLVGDFAGPSAIRTVGEYLKARNATVSAFYTSNVEQYLFLNASWSGFYKNVSLLPLEPGSVFIRALVQTNTGEYSALPMVRQDYRLDTKLYSIGDLVTGFQKGLIQTYDDVIKPAN